MRTPQFEKQNIKRKNRQVSEYQYLITCSKTVTKKSAPA